MKTIFEYRDYKKFVTDRISLRPNDGRGEKSRIAQTLNCHLAYVSQVLNGDAHFSMEQSEALSRYLELPSEETDFLLLLVSFGRAGTRPLQAYYEKQIRQTLEHRMILKNRLKFKKALNIEDQATYYSSWHFAAVHMAAGIPGLQSREALSQNLGIPGPRLAEVISFLREKELLTESNGTLARGAASIHLGSDSPMLSKHHTNWRMRAIESLDRTVPSDLHYSSVISVGSEDIDTIRGLMVESIEKIRAVVRASKDEQLYCYAFDLFSVGKQANGIR